MASGDNVRPQVSILAIGNELLNGGTQDTNSRTLCRFLEERGLPVIRGVLLPDDDAAIAAELRRVIDTSNLIFTTGGLGPTSDDRTRAVIAGVCGAPLEENPVARKKLEALFASRQRPMSENNLRQIFFPRGATVFENSGGTADAFLTNGKNSRGEPVPIISLPGVPKEVGQLLAEQIGPWIERTFPPKQKIRRRYLRCFGRSESYLGKRIEALNIPAHIDVAYRPMFPEILLTFSDENPSRAGSSEELETILRSVREAVGDEFVFSESADENVARCVFELLTSRGLTIAFAESCTGGLAADQLVAIPGSSKSLLGSLVTYSNEAKRSLLDVRPETLERHGAVSAETAKEMAAGARKALSSDIAVSITGVAGPDGGSEAKPVGTVWFGIAVHDEVAAVHQFYNIERNMFRAFAATAALDLVRRKLLGLPLEWMRM